MDIELYQGDITTLDVEAIVNAAAPALLGGGGVDGAIHRAAGPGLLAECRALPEVKPGVRCPTGEARFTHGHRLKARYVIHTVGPVWRDGLHDEPALLVNCYWQSLRLAAQLNVGTIAFPAISCGVYGYPIPQAARIAATETVAWQRTQALPSRILLVAYDAANLAALKQALAHARPASIA